MKSALPRSSMTAVHSPSIFRSLLDAILAVTFPSDCFLCHQEITSNARHQVCFDCWAALQPWTGPMCITCGLPFASQHALDAVEPRCGACIVESPPFDLARSFGLYNGNLRRAILRAKFRHDERLSSDLGELLALTWDWLPRVDASTESLVMAIPLHPSRERERGFNQSLLIAAGLTRVLAKQMNGRRPRLVKHCLRRIRATRPQTGLSIAARRENLRGAFEVVRPEEVLDKAIVLVDDVMTTGATLSACARALKRAGAAKVMAITLARATPQFPDLEPFQTDNGVDGFG